MTILSLNNSSSSSMSNKSNSILSQILNKPIVKKEVKKFDRIELNQHLLQASIDLVNVKRYEPKPCSPPVRSAYHKINWQWVPAQESTVLSKDNASVCFHAECESCFETDAIRGDKPLKRNAFTYWEVTILSNSSNGTSMQIGIGNNKARLNTMGYLNLLGIDKNSYGISHTGHAWHQNASEKFCSAWNEPQVTIGCLFDGYKRQLGYYKNGVCLGVAFENIDMSEDLFPMLSSTVAQSVFRLEFVCETFPSLKDLCRKRVLNERIELTNQILPASVLNFVRND